jgi:hypothetical protein
MNGSFPYTTSWIGSIGGYSIYEYLSEISSNSSNYTSNTSNILEDHLCDTSNILQNQITPTSNIIHTDAGSNVIIRRSELETCPGTRERTQRASGPPLLGH